MSKAKPSEFSKAASALSTAMERGASPEELAEARKEAKEATERAAAEIQALKDQLEVCAHVFPHRHLAPSHHQPTLRRVLALPRAHTRLIYVVCS